MTPYHKLVSDYARLLQSGKSLPLGTFAPARRPEPAAGASRALFFAPHPDDECISGGIAVRLLRESRMEVINIAVTLGSKKDRQAGRLDELKNACRYLGFGLIVPGDKGLERVNAKTREQDKAHWSECVAMIRAIIEEQQPRIIVFPHDRDWNSTHIGTHFLVMDALAQMPSSFQCYLVETEFWGAMTDPNLMAEISNEDIADMIAATTFHVGEVSRNPYHLLLPPWMMDNVRRGAEIVGGQGGTAPEFTFAALYRLRRWLNGNAVPVYAGGKFLSAADSVGDLFTAESAR
jgi:LmbE family N-acetylglucosaminyl deacetylase